MSGSAITAIDLPVRFALRSTESQLRLACQNYRMTERPDLVPDLSQELAACRKRGIERLDLRTHNQAPVERPELQRLAGQYVGARQLSVAGNIAQIKLLLRDAIKAFSATSEADAGLVSALFFGDSQDRVTKPAGELLDIAQKQSGINTDIRFRQARHDAFDAFANFLPGFVRNAARAAEEETDADVTADSALALRQPDHNGGIPIPEVEQRVATTGYIEDAEHFITLLSRADNVTVVGVTNERLAAMLGTALARKRAAMLRPDGCWSSIRVVFLSDELLDRVNDERVYPDPAEARLLRRRQAIYGRWSVRVFLRGLPSRATWAMYDSPYLPPFSGTLFEMPDGRRIVQLLVRRRQRRPDDHLYLEFEDTRGHYFSAVFDEIVNASVGDDRVVPVGVIVRNRFRSTSTRYRRNVLTDGSREKGWLPMVLVVTWRLRNGQAEPVLQLRTEHNATRELHRLTNLSGHIMQEESLIPGTEFGLDDDIPMAAARRRVQMEAGEADVSELALEPVATGRYIHADKEDLFFFVYGCQLPEGLQLWEQAEMSALSVEDLVAIRENQVLRKALALCDAVPLRPLLPQTQAAAFEIAACNLTLHGHEDLARKLTNATAAETPDLDGVAAEIRLREERTRQVWPTPEGETEVLGLAGLQFREFYSLLLPLYGRVGVPGAAEYLKFVTDDEAKRAARDRLSELYRNERLIELIPIEL
jgi:hypothetical protein